MPIPPLSLSTKPSFVKILRHGLAVIVASGVLLDAATVCAGTIVKENNLTALDSGASWVGGIAPGSVDIAQWDGTVTGGQTLSLGSNLSWRGINIESGLGGNLTINAGNGLTLGADGFRNAASRTITFNNSITLAASQVWSSTAGTVIPAGGVATAGYQLTLNGSGALQFKGDITGGGGLVINHSNVKWTNGTNATASAVTLNSGGVLNFDSSVSNGGADRMASLTFNGGTVSVTATSAADQFDEISGALTVNGGAAAVKITPNAGRHAQFRADTLVRNAGGTVLFTGTSLGVNAVTSQTLGAANVVFGTAPGLTGGNGVADTSTISILKGAYADTTASANGFSATGGLATYDADKGVRVLSALEYQTSITDGQTTLDNVRLSNSSGVASTVTLAANTTINSLSLNVGAATSAITLNGAGTLKLNSGILYAWSASPASSGAEMTINNALDLNATEGVILFSANGSSNGTGGALLRLNGVITNDGGNGLTFSGAAGVVELAGSASNTYTGTTTVNSGGSVRLVKTGGATAIIGHLVVNGGTLQNTGSQIADTSDITVNGGSLIQKGGALNSGTGASETFRDLFMNGGAYTAGTGGTSSGITNLRNATITGGTWTTAAAHKTNVSGSVTVNGGLVSVSRANDTTRTTILTLSGDLAIVHTVSGAYTPISFGGGNAAGVAGGRLILNGNLSFTGNGTNASTATIDATAPTNGGGEGTIALSGLRTFDIGNGAAAVDLTILPVLADNGVTIGGLTKTGLGTLALTGASTYTGATNVDAGTLLVGGSLSGTASVNVAATATLATDAAASIGTAAGGNLAISGTLSPGGNGAIGTLTASPGAGGKLSFASGSTFKLDLQLAPASSDLLSFAVTGDWLAGSGLATLSLGGTINYAATYTVFQNVNTSGFAFANITGYDLANYSASVTQSGNDYQLSFVAIPEPNMAGLLTGGFAMLHGWQRMRGRSSRPGSNISIPPQPC